jgi:hypothetical protein
MHFHSKKSTSSSGYVITMDGESKGLSFSLPAIPTPRAPTAQYSTYGRQQVANIFTQMFRSFTATKAQSQPLLSQQQHFSTRQSTRGQTTGKPSVDRFIFTSPLHSLRLFPF